MNLNIDITLGDYVQSITRGFKGVVKGINYVEGGFSVVVVDVKGDSYVTTPGDLTLIASYVPESSPYWLKTKTVDDIPAADEPRRVEASPEVDLKDIRIHSEILSRLLKQTVKGVKKYGDPVLHDNLTAVEWIDHAIDENVDQIVYLTALKHKLLAAEEGGNDGPGTK